MGGTTAVSAARAVMLVKSSAVPVLHVTLKADVSMPAFEHAFIACRVAKLCGDGAR